MAATLCSTSIWNDRIGNTYGSLTLIELVGYKSVVTKGRTNNVKRHKLGKFQCECGKYVIYPAYDVVRGNSSSCGCAKGKAATKPGSAFRRLLNGYKQNARLRGLVWELTNEQFSSLTKGNCYYTGNPPGQKCKATSGEIYLYNGIDRVDNNIGYTENNCVSCCKQVQYAKRALEQSEFINICKKVVTLHG
jgi:hypothetical protein